MNAVQAVLALALLGAEEAPKNVVPQIAYEFRVLEMTGVEWRDGVYSSLQPVTRQRGATIWTTTEAVAAAITKKADQVIAAPKITAFAGAPAHISTKAARGLITHLNRHADGPVNHATKVAYSPETEKIREGFATTVTGRKLDQGVLVKLVLDDTRVTAVHAVYLTEFQEPRDARDHRQVRWEQMQAKLEVPEVVYHAVAGEWLIPNDGVLLASLGAHCAADANGKAVVHERLVFVKAQEIPEPVAIGVAPPKRVMPAPSVPSRTLPQGLNADGEPVALPPLPPEAPAPTARPDSSEPVASPQTKRSGGKSGKDDEQPDDTNDSSPAKRDSAGSAPEAETQVRKASTQFEAAPRGLPPLPAGWPNNDFPGKFPRTRAFQTHSDETDHCTGSRDGCAQAPEPEAEANVPDSHAGACARSSDRDPNLVHGIARLMQAVDQLRIAGDEWHRFWMDDQTLPPLPPQSERDLPASRPRSEEVYELRWPLNGVDVELRVVPRRATEPAARGGWRPSGQPDSGKK